MSGDSHLSLGYKQAQREAMWVSCENKLSLICVWLCERQNKARQEEGKERKRNTNKQKRQTDKKTNKPGGKMSTSDSKTQARDAEIY